MLSSNNIPTNTQPKVNFNTNYKSYLMPTDIPQPPSHYLQNSCDKQINNDSYVTSEPLTSSLNVCYIGAGYVGGTSSAVMAYKCPEEKVTVTVCDIDKKKIDAWNSNNLPIYEPGLEDIVKKQRGKNLFFTTDLNSAINAADIIFISVGTPTKQRGFGAGEAAELKYVENATRKIAQISRNSKIIVEKSTVPCRTAEHIRTILNTNKNSQIKNNISNYTTNHYIKNNNNSIINTNYCNISNNFNINNNINNTPENSNTYCINNLISNESNIPHERINNHPFNNININKTSDDVNINNDDYTNLIDSLSLSNNDSTLTDIDSCSESNTCFQSQDQELKELNKQISDDEVDIKIKKNDDKLKNEKSLIHFEILSNPEFLSEGTAINDLLYPDRVLIGGEPTKEGKKAQNILYQLYSYWIPKKKIITMGLWSTELSKLAANALLAQRISSINALSALCEEVGADIQEISYACGLDSRIGSKFLNASVGFGGSCFKKDILNLVYLSNAFKLPEVAEYWKQVIIMNEYRKSKFIKNIFTKLFCTISGKSIAVFGFSFKKDTKDTRESAAITVVISLLQEGAIVKLYDPKVTKDQILFDIKENSQPQEINENISNIIICNSAYDAAYNSDAIVICTEWDEFKSLDYKNIHNNMNKPAHIFDGRLILNHQELKKIGFNVEAIGKKI